MKVLAEQIQKVTYENHILWEQKFSLVLRPKPKWMPPFIYKRLLKLFLFQTIEGVKS